MTSTSPGAIPHPSGGFQWTPELRERLAVVRGVHAPPDDSDFWLGLQLQPNSASQLPFHVERFNRRAAELGLSWRVWTPEQMEAELRPERLAEPDLQAWAQRMAQMAHHQPTAVKASLPPELAMQVGVIQLAEQGLRLHGLLFMLDLVLWLSRLQSWGVDEAAVRLRAALARAPQAEHDAAIARLEGLGGNEAMRLQRALLCPHRGDWVRQAADDIPIDHTLIKLRHCVLSPDDARLGLRGVDSRFDYLASAVLLQIALHGAGALPLLGEVVARASNREDAERWLTLMLRLRVPELPAQLVAGLERLEVRNALDKLSEEFPAAVLLALLQADGKEAQAAALRLALRAPAPLPAVRANLLDSPQLTALDEALARTQIAEAAPDQLPALLRQPPWLERQRPAPLPTLELVAPTTPGRIEWAPGERERHLAFDLRLERRNLPVDDRTNALLFGLRLLPPAFERARSGGSLTTADFQPPTSVYDGPQPDQVLLLPESIGVRIWNAHPATAWYSWEDMLPQVQAILARYGEAALPGLVNLCAVQAEVGFRAAQAIDLPSLVPLALAARRLKKVRHLALGWLRRHPDTAARGALPLAFGRDKAARDDAAFALRWLAQQGLEPQLRAAAAELGAEAALQALLDFDPLRVLPARMPKLPPFYVPASFRRPRLREGGLALPLAALENVGLMLAISSLEAPYAGLQNLRELCTPESLAGFAWDLFEAWLAAGAPGKEAWAFNALGHLGNDETAHRLAPRLRAWPSEGASSRAASGLEVLAAIGSDAALMHLNGIAERVKSKPLQDRAQETIAAVAEARGLTPEQLADRLVPELGLEADGTLRLDFGPRAFEVRFDETLKPLVLDAQGLRLKDLPKPLASDDAAKAEAATERFQLLKKEAKAVATLQLQRLELAMVAQRRWSAPEFRSLFVQHPLMRHLAGRLIWGVYGADGSLQTALRIAEDGTLADAEDQLLVLPEEAQLGIAHPLDLTPAQCAAFGGLLADYKILQPFKQIDRVTPTLTPEEAQGQLLTRYATRRVATVGLIALLQRGDWRIENGDSGVMAQFGKPLGRGLRAELALTPGCPIGQPTHAPTQQLTELRLLREGGGAARWADLTPVALSELLRDIEWLPPAKD